MEKVWSAGRAPAGLHAFSDEHGPPNACVANVIRLFNSLVAAVVLSSIVAGCGSTSVTEIAGPDATRCQSSLSAVNPIPASGGRVDATVAAARECDWTVSSQSPWLQVSPSSGQGGMTVTLTAAENPAAAPRSGAVSLNGQTITLTQAASPCQFAVDATRVEVSGAGDTKAVTVSAPTGCNWTAQSAVAWIRAIAGSGSGSGLASFTVDRNPAGPRTATVQVAGNSVVFVQGDAPSDPRPEPVPTPVPTPTPTPTPGPAPTPTPPPDSGCGNRGNGKCKDSTTVLFAVPTPGVPP